VTGLFRGARGVARIVRRWPAFALGAALSLTLGVGVSGAVFGFVQSVFTPPLRGEHARDLQRLVRVPAIKTYEAYRSMVERLRTLDIGVYYRGSAGIGRGAFAAPLQLECISHTYLHLLEVRPAIGRTFEAREDVEGGPPLLLLEYRFWMRHFEGDPAVVGSIVDVNARRYMVVGVAPLDFGGVESPGADAWTLLAASPRECLGLDDWRQTHSLAVVGRIREPFTLAQAAGEMESQRSALAELNGPLFPMGTGAPVLPLYGPGRSAWSPERRILRWVGAGAAAALLLVCANVSVLMLLGVARRTDEMAVRLRLGARRRQVLAQVLGEALALGAVCAAPAVVVAAWTATLMEALAPVGSVGEFLGLRGFGMVAAIALGAGLGSGVMPALAAARTRVDTARPGGVEALTKRRSLARAALLAAQVAVAFVLVMMAGLFARSSAAAGRDVGYDLEHLIVASLDLERTSFGASRAQSVFDLLLRRAQRQPAVRSAALGSQPLMGFSREYQALQLPGSDDGMAVPVAYVTPSYFRTLGTRLVRGRGFESEDVAGAGPVMIVSEGLAQRLWPSGEALGSCAFVGFPNPVCTEVVGVSESRRADTITEVDDEIFLPLSHDVVPRVLFVRTHGSADASIGSVATALRGALPDLPFLDVRLVADLIDDQTRAVRLAATMSNLFGAIAVVLASIGIYGAMAVSMRQRRFELGIRLAVGAGRGAVTWLLLRRSLAILGAGWIVGGAAIAIVAPALTVLLFGVAPLDTASFLWAAGIVGTSVAIGAVPPAIRAAGLDPARALRG